MGDHPAGSSALTENNSGRMAAHRAALSSRKNDFGSRKYKPKIGTNMTWWTNLWTAVEKDEKWVVSELAKGWQLLQTVGHTLDVDIQGVFGWISTNHLAITNGFKGALSALAAVGAVIPQSAPAVIAATLAIDAATAAVDSLSKAIVAGNTPLSTAVNAYHAVKDAETAVTSVLKQATTKPTS